MSATAIDTRPAARLRLARRAGALVGAGIVLVGLAVGAVGWVSAGMIMHPPRLAVHDDPASYGLHPEFVNIASPNTAKPLKGWLFHHPDDHGRAVLFIHGWGSHSQHMLHDYLTWLAKRYTLLAFDLSNHGASPDGLTTLGPREVKDARAAADFLVARGYKTLGVLGTSMGGATAIDLAAEDPAIKAVVTDGAFASPAHVPRGHFLTHGYPFPDVFAASTAWMLALRTGEDEEGAAAIHHVAAIAPRPILIIHGEKDRVISPDDATALYDAAKPPKSILLVPGADHMSEATRSPHALDKEDYERGVERLFDALK